MRLIAIGSGIGLLIAAAGCRVSTAAVEPPWPSPPRQDEPWTPPPSRLPRFLNAATADLCSQGLADPRGCEYRRMRIKVGNVWGGEGTAIETAGWALPPAGPEAEPRFAIAWNGLVYPLEGLDAPADLDADVRSMVLDLPAGRRTSLGWDRTHATAEPHSATVATPLPIRACLLLRLGRPDLAEVFWEKGLRLTLPRAAGAPALDLNSYGVSYLSLARDLAWYHFDRAIGAHMRGDDATALSDVRFLDRFARSVDLRAEEMGFPPPDRARVGPGQIDFLAQLPEFLDDQERRAQERARPEPPPAGRIEALIRNLDQVAARQWSQPGGVTLGESPIVQELVAQGEGAVAALIRDFRAERRLTRSVGFGRDFHRHRHIYRADQAAYAALTGILKKSDFTQPSPDGQAPSRQLVADRIEAYWWANRGTPVVERWYATLADDDAGESAWLEAAGHITRPENVKLLPGSGPFVTTVTTEPKPGERPKRGGEALRDAREPSVAALMARRAESMAQKPGSTASRRMAEMLAAWDPAAGLATFRDLMRLARERFDRLGQGRDSEAHQLAVAIAGLAQSRVEIGDDGALAEYAAWIKTTSPERLGGEALKALEPFHRWPADPALAEAAAWLFGDPESPWVPLIGRQGSRPVSGMLQLPTSPLLGVPAFRAALLKDLQDRTPIGKARMDDGMVRIELEPGHSQGRSPRKTAEDAPAPLPEATLRRCDLIAWQLAALDDAPEFNPCWDEARREAAFAAVADYLRRHADGPKPPHPAELRRLKIQRQAAGLDPAPQPSP